MSNLSPDLYEKLIKSNRLNSMLTISMNNGQNNVGDANNFIADQVIDQYYNSLNNFYSKFTNDNDNDNNENNDLIAKCQPSNYNDNVLNKIKNKIKGIVGDENLNDDIDNYVDNKFRNLDITRKLVENKILSNMASINALVDNLNIENTIEKAKLKVKLFNYLKSINSLKNNIDNINDINGNIITGMRQDIVEIIGESIDDINNHDERINEFCVSIINSNNNMNNRFFNNHNFNIENIDDNKREKIRLFIQKMLNTIYSTTVNNLIESKDLDFIKIKNYDNFGQVSGIDFNNIGKYIINSYVSIYSRLNSLDNNNNNEINIILII